MTAQTTRRSLLKFGLAAGLVPFLPAIGRAQTTFAPQPSDWRRFELSTVITPPAGQGATQVWLPLPDVTTDWQRSVGNSWTGNAVAAEVVTDPATGVQMLRAEFAADEAAPTLTLISTVETRNRTTGWAPTAAQEDPAVLQANLASSSMKPLDGIVGETAVKITAGATTDIEKVKAIYDWIVTTCHRDTAVKGCGTGDIAAVLTQANFGGKCADLNGLFVGLVRAAGVPARDVYGVRVAPSAFGYKQLGAKPENVSGAQHCRAEVWLEGQGWVAMDPADVLKVMRQEKDEWIKDLNDPLIVPVREGLYGNWEGNWVAFNTAQDVGLPGAEGTLPFLMYPQGRNAAGTLDELDAKGLAYSMSGREV